MNATERQVLLATCKLLGTSFTGELKKIAESHRLAYQEANEAYCDLRKDALKKATALIDAQLAQEKAEVNALSVAWFVAKRDVEEARIMEAQAGYRSPDGGKLLPLGAKVERDLPRRYGKTAIQYGIIEVCERETVFSEKLRRDDEPAVGSIFVRLYMKNGKLGKTIDDYLSAWRLAK